MFLFKRRKKEDAHRHPIRIPVSEVKELAAKGLSEPEIVSILKKKGYSPFEIERALSLAMKKSVADFPKPEKREQPQLPPREPLKPPESMFTFEKTPFLGVEEKKEPSSPTPPQPQPMPQPQRHSIPQPQALPQPQPQPQPIPQVEVVQPDITLEELIEGIVADKLKELDSRFEELRKRDDNLQIQLLEIRREIEKIKEEMKARERNMLERIEIYSDKMEEINAKISGIERVLRDFMPKVADVMRAINSVLEKERV